MALPDQALVVRGLPFDRNAFERSVRLQHKKTGVHALSVFSIADVTASEVVRRSRQAGYDLFGELIRVTTAGDLRAGGFEIRPDYAWHYLVVFAAKPNGAVWQQIDQAFGPTRPAIQEGE